MHRTKLLALSVIVAACASTASHIDVSPAEIALPAQPMPEAAPPRVVEVEDTGPTVLTRAVLQRTVAEGIGAFLAGVDLSPVVDRGRFTGFRLERARGLRRWNAGGMGLRAGDVILRVNGQVIERPEQAQTVFWSLRDANEVVVDVLRAGAPLTLRVPVLANETIAAVYDAGVALTSAR